MSRHDHKTPVALELLSKLLITPALIEAPPNRLAASLCQMLTNMIANTPSWRYSGPQPLSDLVHYQSRPDGTDLQAALATLDPLSQPSPTRYLFLGTRGKWTVFLSNLSSGDAGGALALRLTRALGVRAVQFVTSDEESRSFAQIFHIYENGEEMRMLEVIEDEEGTYIFRNEGKPLPFEDTRRYKARRKRDRFTRDMLLQYLAQLGARPYDLDFYHVDARHPAHLVERIDKDSVIKSRFVFTPLSDMRR